MKSADENFHNLYEIQPAKERENLLFKDISKKLEFMKSAFSKLNKEGCLIIKDTIFNDEEFINKIKSELDGADHGQYSSIVATKHNKNTNIAHYSDIIFSELQLENEKRNDTFNILQKK